MNTTFGRIKLAQLGRSQSVFGLFDRYRDAFQKRRQHAQVRAALVGLDDRELHDIGIARGEIDYVAANGAAGLDPRFVGPPVANTRGGGKETGSRR